MKNKKLIIIIVGILLLVVGGFYVMSSSQKAAPAPQVDQTPVEEQVSTMKPEDIGLSLTQSTDGRKVIMAVTNTKDISGLDYQLSYTSKGNIPRGVLGHINVKQPGQSVSQEITLGTCSDVCHYDEGVTEIKLILKVTKSDGSTSQIEKSLAQ